MIPDTHGDHVSIAPLVSFVIPARGDDEGLRAALASCLSQHLRAIEILVPTRAGIDIDHIARIDQRIRVLEIPDIATPAEARRAGVLSSAGEYVQFLEVGDELEEDAIAAAYEAAAAVAADMVAFDAARKVTLHDDEILRRLFPAERCSHVHLRAHLFRTNLLRQVYAELADASMPVPHDRAFDFLTCAHARTYVSLDRPLRRPRTGAAEEGHTANPVIDFHNAVHAIESFTGIEQFVRTWAKHSPNPEPLSDGYDWARLTLIAEALSALARISEESREAEIAHLRARTSDVDAVSAAALLAPRTLGFMTQHSRDRRGFAIPHHVMLAGDVVAPTGLPGLLISQAALLVNAGHKVTIVTQQPGVLTAAVPDGVTLVRLSGLSRRDALVHWDQLCRTGDVSLVLDHRVSSSVDWLWHALVARAAGVPTIGFAPPGATNITRGGRDSDLLQIMFDVLAELVVSSPQEVAFWKLRGAQRVSYLPRPCAPFLMEFGSEPRPPRVRTDERLALLWWGTLDYSKLPLEVASALLRQSASFRLRIVVAGWSTADTATLARTVARLGLTANVELLALRSDRDALNAIDSSDLLLQASVIGNDGAPTLEALTRGLPVLTIRAPWQASAQQQPGVVDVRWGDLSGVVEAIAAVAADPAYYKALSHAATQTARRATDWDFPLLYRQLMSGSLPAAWSPEPTIDDGRAALDLLIFTAENTPAESASSLNNTPGLRREPRGKSRHRSFGAKIERTLTPAGHRLLEDAPWLRPFARQVKRALLAR